jgi:hypothetical protein
VEHSIYLQMIQSFLPKAQNGIILCVGVSVGCWKDATVSRFCSAKTVLTTWLLGFFGVRYILIEAGSRIVALLCGMLKRKGAVKSCL